jgi:hypothetical protein
MFDLFVDVPLAFDVNDSSYNYYTHRTCLNNPNFFISIVVYVVVSYNSSVQVSP